jgi:hypothetical protein
MRYFKIFMALAVALTATFTLNAQAEGGETNVVELNNGLTVMKTTDTRTLFYDFEDEAPEMNDVYVEVGFIGGFAEIYYVKRGDTKVEGTEIVCDFTWIHEMLTTTVWGEVVKDEYYEPFIEIGTQKDGEKKIPLMEVLGDEAREMIL